MTASNLEFAFSSPRSSANSWAFRVSRENAHTITVPNFQPLLRVTPLAARRQPELLHNTHTGIAYRQYLNRADIVIDTRIHNHVSSAHHRQGNRILIWRQQPASEFAVAEVEYVVSSKD